MVLLLTLAGRELAPAAAQAQPPLAQAPAAVARAAPRSSKKAKPVSVLVWTGHSGPYHDHFSNGLVLAKALNMSKRHGGPDIRAHVACDAHETTPCEEVFASKDLAQRYDVILIYADTYENPDRGSMSDAQWDGLFGFVRGGKGLFAPRMLNTGGP